MEVAFHELIGPKGDFCQGNKRSVNAGSSEQDSLLDYIRDFAKFDSQKLSLCLRQYLISKVEMTTTPTPPYLGQYGDLPFQDPWWKIVLCIVAILLAIASSIAEAVDGLGDISVSGDGGGD
jgi:hypothetical protein